MALLPLGYLAVHLPEHEKRPFPGSYKLVRFDRKKVPRRRQMQCALALPGYRRHLTVDRSI